jgi:PHD/YefM family antitoxin component YafN of YafNO toxin-antitoxin module
MATRATRYLVDERGRKRAVLLDMKEYSRLLRRLEELEDTLALDEAVRTASEFRDYGEVRSQLEHDGRL